MIVHLLPAHLTTIREYAEALTTLLNMVAARLHQPMRQALLQQTFILTQALSLGAPPEVNGVDHADLTEAHQALCLLDMHLQRLQQTQALAPERQMLLAQLHRAVFDEVAYLLHLSPISLSQQELSHA